ARKKCRVTEREAGQTDGAISHRINVQGSCQHCTGEPFASSSGMLKWQAGLRYVKRGGDSTLASEPIALD
ncbi:hypothetical protein L3X16_18945, partial [Pseudomonas stutzeri]|nr:hypothetical protein [Stutzerimonas stutzeri]